MFLSDLSIKQPVFATMMMAALAVLGLTSYQALKVDLFPDVEFPVVTVTTRYTGASPETVERDVTKFIEEAVNTVEGVRHIESTSQEGLSSIVVQFNVGVPTLNASQDIRGKVAAIRGELPREIDEPIILRIDPASTPIVSVAVNAPTLTPRAVSDIADKLVKRRLENVPGVGAVNLVGEAKREIQVVVDRTRLESYGLSLVQVVDALRTQNVDAPVGTADRGATEAMVRVAARGTSAAQIGDIPVKQLGDRTILVRDVAQVIDGVEEADQRRVRQRAAGHRARRAEAGRREHRRRRRRRARGRREDAARAAAGRLAADGARRLDVHPRVDRGRAGDARPRRPADRLHRVPVPQLVAIDGHHRASRCRFRSSPRSSPCACSASR